MTFRRALRSGLVLAALTLVTSGIPATGWAETGSSGQSIVRDGGCTTADTDGVTVVVDFAGLGGGLIVRCAKGLSAASRGADAFAAAGISWSAVSSQPGFVCRIDGRPSADETIATGSDPAYQEACLNTPPTDAYWSYWKSAGSGSWDYSSAGIGSGRVRLGGFEGWSFSTGGQVAPGFDPVTQPAPVAPVPEPPAGPPAVDPPVADPPVAEPPAAEPPAAEPPAAEPPAADPPAADPPPAPEAPTTTRTPTAASDPTPVPESTPVVASPAVTAIESSAVTESSSAELTTTAAGTEPSPTMDPMSSAQVSTAAAAETPSNTGAFLAATVGVLLIGGLGAAAVVISRRRRSE